MQRPKNKICRAESNLCFWFLELGLTTTIYWNIGARRVAKCLYQVAICSYQHSKYINSTVSALVSASLKALFLHSWGRVWVSTSQAASNLAQGHENFCRPALLKPTAAKTRPPPFWKPRPKGPTSAAPDDKKVRVCRLFAKWPYEQKGLQALEKADRDH